MKKPLERISDTFLITRLWLAQSHDRGYAVAEMLGQIRLLNSARTYAPVAGRKAR
jgi:hypothetical protein